MNNIHIPTQTSSLSIWLNYLKQIHYCEIDLGLERIFQIAQRLNLLNPTSFVYIVTGTNGKGTTCRILEIILISAGYKVGVYSSPHIINYTERVRIQGQELSESLHVSSFFEIESKRNDIPLTYFEYSTLSALKLFKQSNLDVIILEVGLGGRLDATNIIDADISIITNIDIDHTCLLGVDRESIAREKAGIFRYNKPAIVGELDVLLSIDSIAKEVGANLIQNNRNWNYIIKESSWSLYDMFGKLSNLPLLQIPLSNAATALVALRASKLNISEIHIRKNLPLVTLPGRFQIINNLPLIILDVAHNPHAAKYLSYRLSFLLKTNYLVHAIIGMMNDKDISGTLEKVISHIDYWYCATLPKPRGAKAEDISIYLSLHNKKTQNFTNVIDAWKTAYLQADIQDIILVFGSFSTVSAVMKYIKGKNLMK